jgi:dTDP-4-dehydrorhamnose reductase
LIKERVTIFGRKSWLGDLIARTLGAYHSDADITDYREVARVLEEQGTQVAVNVAAKTGGPNIDGCDASEKTQAAAFRVNTVGPMYLFDECRRAKARIVHISTAFVLADTPPTEDGFTEDVRPVLPGVKSYTASKAAADLMLRVTGDALILRLNLPIDGKPHPRNFIDKLVSYPEVQDVTHTLTTVPMLTRVMSQLIMRKAHGVYHVVHPEPVSNGQIITWYRELVDPNHAAPIVPPRPTTRPGIVARPDHLISDNILVGRAEPAIRECLRQYKQALRMQAARTI